MHNLNLHVRNTFTLSTFPHHKVIITIRKESRWLSDDTRNLERDIIVLEVDLRGRQYVVNLFEELSLYGVPGLTGRKLNPARDRATVFSLFLGFGRAGDAQKVCDDFGGLGWC